MVKISYILEISVFVTIFYSYAYNLHVAYLTISYQHTNQIYKKKKI